jgi:hypothetical protein
MGGLSFFNLLTYAQCVAWALVVLAQTVNAFRRQPLTRHTRRASLAAEYTASRTGNVDGLGGLV